MTWFYLLKDMQTRLGVAQPNEFANAAHGCQMDAIGHRLLGDQRAGTHNALTGQPFVLGTGQQLNAEVKA